MGGGTTFIGGYNFVNTPSYYEEAATGYATAISTAAASGVFGKVSDISVEVDPGTNEFRSLASEDVYTQVVGQIGVRGRITFALVDLSSTFINYSIKANANASGDISRPIHIVWAQRAVTAAASTPVTTYFALRGCRTNNTTISASPGGHITAECEFFAHSIVFTTVSGTYNSTYVTEPTTPIWNYEDGGANPVTLNSRNYDTTDLSVSVGRNIKEVYVLGTSYVALQGPTIREITADGTFVYLTGSTQLDVEAATSYTLSWVMKTGAGTLTVASCVPISWSLPQTVADETYERVSFRGGTVAAI